MGSNPMPGIVRPYPNDTTASAIQNTATITIHPVSCGGGVFLGFGVRTIAALWSG